jgi:hypothetical protein
MGNFIKAVVMANGHELELVDGARYVIAYDDLDPRDRGVEDCSG